ncbi:MAG: phosphatase PAP2 family protein [Gemmatimonadaceae bacterium]
MNTRNANTRSMSARTRATAVLCAAVLCAASLLSLLSLAPPLVAQPSDTTRVSHGPLFVPRDAYIAAGFVLGTVALAPLDREYAKRLQRPNTQENRFFRDAASGFRVMGGPGALLVGVSMYGVGRLAGFERLADLGLHGTEAIIVSGAVTGLIKGVAGRPRPDATASPDPEYFEFGRGFREDNTYSSFPSGHATAAFAAAAVVTSETSRWWPRSRWVVAPVMYGGATLVGLSRMYHNRHWASDVVMGAGIGTFAGLKVVRYHHAHPGNRIDQWLLSGTLAPGADGGVVVAWSWPWPSP